MVDGNKNNMLPPPLWLINCTCLMGRGQHCGLSAIKVLLKCMPKIIALNFFFKPQKKNKTKTRPQSNAMESSLYRSHIGAID